MNAFLNVLERYESGCSLQKGALNTLQVNMGNLCNQSCRHCHMESSPLGKKRMNKEVVEHVLKFLERFKIETLDITGGAPELNENFDYLVVSAQPLVGEIIVRSNLTVFFEPGKGYLPEFFKEKKVHLICSLPCYNRGNVDAQRGQGTFDKSVRALRMLNLLGFSKQESLKLDLVYNPVGGSLPPEQSKLEEEYKEILEKDYGIAFNRLISIVNVPIKRFKNYLKKKGQYDEYFDLLKGSFNPLVLNGLMCRTFLSVGHDGRLYDCDFNQALGLGLKKSDGNWLTIDNAGLDSLEGRDIIFGKHCLSCTAGGGSSCQGAIIGRNSGKPADKRKEVKRYYGKIIKNKKELKTNSCCLDGEVSKKHKDIIGNIEEEILMKFYGCGSPLPPLLKDCCILDLGCGTGRDVYLAACLAGENGFVTGVDMTGEQLNVAAKYKERQMKRFGFKTCNVDFVQGYIEDLKEAGIKDSSVDVVISNCVINLSSDKEKVFREIFRVLKPGGELYFSDVFSGRRVPSYLRGDPVFYGECLGGALYIEDFRRLLGNLGCFDYRVVFKRRITINNREMESKAGSVDFYSMTIRIFKLDSLEDSREDYGQSAVYLGTIDGSFGEFIFDNENTFFTGKPRLVCGNTASMLTQTRYRHHFRVTGDRRNHYGGFKSSFNSEKRETKDSFGGKCC